MKEVVSLHAKECNMLIEYEKDYLEELYTGGKCSNKKKMVTTQSASIITIVCNSR